MLKKIARLSAFPFTSIIYYAAGFFTRSEKVWVFGAQKNNFNDSTKHLYTYVTAYRPDIKAIWITGDQALVKKIRAVGGLAYNRYSLKGLFWTYKAKYWFITTLSTEVNYYASKQACIVNLWHGVGFKKTYFDTDNAEDYERYNNPGILQKTVFEPFTYRLSDYCVTTSDRVSADTFSTALKVDMKHCLPFGLARTDIFFFNPPNYDDWVQKWGTPTLGALLSSIEKANKVWMYMPTWREAAPGFLTNIGLNYQKVNESLVKKNEILILKLHPFTPNTIIGKLQEFSNIIIADQNEDMFAVFPHCDVLITDYSSIYVDYLLLDKPIVFFCFDLEEYNSKSRGFVYNYDDVTPGIKVQKPNELEDILCSSTFNDDGYKLERERVRNMFFDYTDGKACERITNYLCQL